MATQDNNRKRPDNNKEPQWANVPTVNGTSGQNNVIEPSTSKKQLGWDYQEKPARNFDNWAKNLFWQWLTYLDDLNSFIVRQQDIADNTITIRGGTYRADGETRVDISDSVSAAFTFPVTDPRIDIVTINLSTQSFVITTGVENPSPVAPTVPTDHVLLAEISLAITDTVIINSMITDRRSSFESVRKASETIKGVLEIATVSEHNALTDLDKICVPGRLPISSSTQLGLIETGTNTEIQTGTSNQLAVVASSLKTIVNHRAVPTNFRKVMHEVIHDNMTHGTAFDWLTELTINTTTTVGPTGSGATKIWTALDDLNLDGIEMLKLRLFYSYNVSVPTTSNNDMYFSVTLSATSRSPAAFRGVIREVTNIESSNSQSKAVTDIQDVETVCDSNGIFQFHYSTAIQGGGDSTFSFIEGDIHLIGAKYK